jgi:hypothetical protein
MSYTDRIRKLRKVLIDTVKKDWKRCSKTGRHLNSHNPLIQDSSKCITEEIEIVEAVKQAIRLTAIDKEAYKHTTGNSIRVIEAIYTRLLREPERKLQINSNILFNNETLIKSAGLKKIIGKMETLGHVTIYQGFAYKETSTKTAIARPMCIELAIST